MALEGLGASACLSETPWCRQRCGMCEGPGTTWPCTLSTALESGTQDPMLQTTV